MARVLLLVPSATYRVGDFLEAARTLGVDVVIAGDEPQAMGDLMGRRSLQVPMDDPAAAARLIVAHDGGLPVDAVIAIDDRGAVAAAAASQQLGLRHNPPESVAATRDKLVMRIRLAAAEVAQPGFAALPLDADDD